MSRPKRVHPSGRLTFRRNVRAPKQAELPLAEAGDEAVAWSDVVPAGRAGPVELEIGCGKGAFLLAAAAARPDVYFAGVEAGPDYARYCAGRVARAGLDNVVLVADDARLFLKDTVPAGALSRIHVYHPDPWPKRRHRKRRLVSAEFATLATRALRPGGELLIATDNTRYFGEILAVLGAHEGLVRSRKLEEHYGDELTGVAFGPTNFAKKYEAEARPRHRAVYVTPKRDTMSHTGTDTWTRVASVDELPEDEGKAVTVGETELALFRDGDGVACLEDSCPHRGAALSEGKIREGEVICPWHGWRFGLKDGECSTLPGSMPAKVFETKVDDGEIWVKV